MSFTPPVSSFPTIKDLQHRLDAGETNSVELVELALGRIEDTNGEGGRVFTAVWAEQARAAAQASDMLRKAGLARSAIEGMPISIKDLFDVAGQVTRAGSALLRNAPPPDTMQRSFSDY